MYKGCQVRAKKSLSQNFLIEPSIVQKIIKFVDIAEDDCVIEIGAGLGAITRPLVERAQMVFAVEKDSSLVEILKKELGESKNLCIIEGDILTLDVGSLPIGQKNKLIKLVGNIPYSISSPVIFWILKNRRYFSTAIIMLQKEVARRICSKPSSKEYGILSVMVQSRSFCKLLFDISPTCFRPVPSVISSILQIKFPKRNDAPIDEKLFEDVVKSAFANRRKTLVNSLKANSRFLSSFSPVEITNFLIELEFSPKARAENLSPDDYIRLTNFLSEKLGQ